MSHETPSYLLGKQRQQTGFEEAPGAEKWLQSSEKKLCKVVVLISTPSTHKASCGLGPGLAKHKTQAYFQLPIYGNDSSV